MRKLIWLLLLLLIPIQTWSADLTPNQIRVEWKTTGRDFIKTPMTTPEKIRILMAEDTLLDSQIAAIEANPNGEVNRITTYLTGQAASAVSAIQFKTQEAKIMTQIKSNPAEYIKQRVAMLKGYKVLVEAHLAKLRGGT